MSTPAGWYPDATGVPRWWDGYQWSGEDSLQAPVTQELPPVPAGTSSSTVWVWLIVLLPLLNVILTFVYLAQMQQKMFEFLALVPLDGASPDVEGLIAAQLGTLLTPWYLVLVLISWAVYGLCVWFSVRDAGELAARGFVRPFPWAWSFLSSLVYVIGRHVVIRRRGGRGAGPLVASLVIQGTVLLGTTIWASFFVSQLFATMFTMIPVR